MPYSKLTFIKIKKRNFIKREGRRHENPLLQVYNS